MLNLSNAARIYTDIEILQEAAKYIYANGYTDKKLDESVDLLSKVLKYDYDFIKGFVLQAIRELKGGNK